MKDGSLVSNVTGHGDGRTEYRIFHVPCVQAQASRSSPSESLVSSHCLTLMLFQYLTQSKHPPPLQHLTGLGLVDWTGMELGCCGHNCSDKRQFLGPRCLQPGEDKSNSKQELQVDLAGAQSHSGLDYLLW